MLIYRTADGVHGQRMFGNPCAGPFHLRVLQFCCCRSAHTCLIYRVFNDALQTAIGCLHTSPRGNLPILAGIQPAELRRKETTLFLARCVMELGHLLNSAFTCPSSGDAWHFKSRHLLYPLHNNSSVHLSTTTDVRTLGGSPLECGVVGQHPLFRNGPEPC